MSMIQTIAVGLLLMIGPLLGVSAQHDSLILRDDESRTIAPGKYDFDVIAMGLNSTLLLSGTTLD